MIEKWSFSGREIFYRQLFQGRFLLVDGIVYSVNRWQENLIRYSIRISPN